MSDEPIEVPIGIDGRPVLLPRRPESYDGPDLEAAALCDGLGVLLGVDLVVEQLDVRADGGLTVAAVVVGEHGPAGEWSTDAAAAEVDELSAVRHAVVAAVLGHDDVFTAAMRRFVAGGLAVGAVVTSAVDRPVLVGSLDEADRLLTLIELTPAANLVSVRTGPATYVAACMHRHACAWRQEERATPDLIAGWFRSCVSSDALGMSLVP